MGTLARPALGLPAGRARVPILHRAPTVLVPIIVDLQLIVGWLCLHNAVHTRAVKDEPSEC